MDKNTLSQYGWVVIVIIILIILISLSGPFGSYIKLSTASSVSAMTKVMKKEIANADMNVIGIGNFNADVQHVAANIYDVPKAKINTLPQEVQDVYNENPLPVIFATNYNRFTIPEGSTASVERKNIDNYFVDHNGITYVSEGAINKQGLHGTGEIIQVTKQGITERCYLVVVGDMDGNGLINVADTSRHKGVMVTHTLDYTKMSPIAMMFTDLNCDGIVDENDSYALRDAVTNHDIYKSMVNKVIANF